MTAAGVGPIRLASPSARRWTFTTVAAVHPKSRGGPAPISWTG